MARKRRTQRKPLWDWTVGLTNSSMALHLQCPEQFALNYLEGWTKKGFSIPLEFGTVIHLCIAHPKAFSSPEKVAQEVCRSYEAERRRTLFHHTDLVTMQKTLTLAEVIFPHYIRYYKEDDTHQIWVDREKPFEIAHTFDSLPQGNNLSTPEIVKLRGIMDGVYRMKDQNIGLFETKTASQIDDLAIQSGLRADMQTLLYLYALSVVYDRHPTQVLYNVIRRPGQILGKTEDMSRYRARVDADIHKRPEWYFRRYEVTVLEQDLRNFITGVLDPVIRRILQWWRSVEEAPFDRFKSPYHYLNLNALLNKYGKAALYDLIVLGRKNGYSQRSLVFPEFAQYAHED